MNQVYEKIANMTNKEAAEVLSNMMLNTNVARANGKTVMALSYNMAISKAIDLLENTPDEEE